MSSNPFNHKENEPLLNIPNAGKMAVIALLGAAVTQGMQLLDALEDLSSELRQLANSLQKIELCDSHNRSP